MMNTKLYKAVYQLAEQLMEAANKNDQTTFDTHYSLLKTICTANENTEKDHPVQWETLADFTEDLEEALTLYQKALTKATAINAKDYRASITFAMAKIHLELNQTEQAINNLHAAKISANKIEDKELKAEIEALLKVQLEG